MNLQKRGFYKIRKKVKHLMIGLLTKAMVKSWSPVSRSKLMTNSK